MAISGQEGGYLTGKSMIF